MSLDTTEFSDAGPTTRPQSSTPPFRRNSFLAMISTALESKSFLIMEKTPSPTSPPHTSFSTMASSIASSSSSIVFTTNMSQSSLHSSIPDEFKGPPETFHSVFVGRHRHTTSLPSISSSGASAEGDEGMKPAVRVVGRGGLGSRPRKHLAANSDVAIPSASTSTATSPTSDKFPSSVHTAQSSVKDGKAVVRVAGRGGSGSFRLISTKKSKASMKMKSKPSLPSLSEAHTYPPSPLPKDVPKLGEPGPSRLTSTTTPATAEKPKVVRYGGRGGAGSRPRHVSVDSKSGVNAPQLRLPLKWKSKDQDRKGKSRASQSSVELDCIVGDNASEVSSIHFAPVVVPLPKPVPPPPTHTAYDDDPPPSPTSVGTPLDSNAPSLSPPSIVSSSKIRTRRIGSLKLAKTLGENPYTDGGNFVFVRASTNATRRESIRMSGRTIKPSLSLDDATGTASTLPLTREHVSTAYRKPSQRKELPVLPVTPNEAVDVKEPDTLDSIPTEVFPMREVIPSESATDNELEAWVDDKFEAPNFHSRSVSMIVFSDPPSPAPPAFESECEDYSEEAHVAFSPFSRPDTPFSDAIATPPRMLGVVQVATDSQGFYISRDEKHAQHGWIGQWNRKDMREVLSGLREL